MRVLVAPMMAMAESSGPASRSRVLASAIGIEGMAGDALHPGRLLRRDPRWRERPTRPPPDAPWHAACRREADVPLAQRLDWSRVGKEDYLSAMERSPLKDVEIKALLAEALRDSGLELYVAELPEGFAKGVSTAPHFDFAELLPRATVFANHGGQNSLMDRIAYGTPQLICP